MEPNQYDKGGKCLKAGDRAEKDFIWLALKKGWTISRSTPDQDINEHWDYKLEKNSKFIKVEIKAMKKLKRSDAKPQDKWTWLELHGVQDSGWVYGGKSDLIAFEREHSFFIISREKLIEIIPNIINLDSMVDSPEAAKYKVYQRAGRQDKISLVEFEKLEKIKEEEWQKI